MTDTFLGLREVDWVGIESVSLAIGTVVLLVTGVFWYQQVRQGTRAQYFAGVTRMQELIDKFQGQREALLNTFPLELALEDRQFMRNPGGRYRAVRMSEGDRRQMLLSEPQQSALASLSKDQVRIARDVINALNDVGELVEDGFVPRDVFFGKHHLLVLRCCGMLEAIRRRLEEQSGGNYGQRLLRLRHRAKVFNDIYPRHRDVAVFIANEHGRRMIYSSPQGSVLLRAEWLVRRWLRFY